MARFATSARTVDMLGRQQIAGIPTAVNELFKNAHDAYATSVVVDWYRDQALLILRDDGVGMTHGDFLNRWLTLGTDSKVGSRGSLASPPRPRHAPQRPTLGEKGIGRLAIAALGSQTLVITRPMEPDAQGRRPTTVALIPWMVFSSAGVTLEEIDIPLAVLDEGGYPGRFEINELVKQMRENIAPLSSRMELPIKRTLERDLARWSQVDLRRLVPATGPQLTDRGHGTHFVITPTDETLPAEVDGKGDQSASPMVKLLIGFSNTMSSDIDPSSLRSEFWERRADRLPRDLIGQDEFFTTEDFERVDHEFSGVFDERGTFHGQVSIFGQPAIDHVVPWSGPQGPTRCGPFRIRFGYVQGERKHSRLADEDRLLMQAKLSKIAGLYIYRDAVRILPYGTSDVDYLQIEDRRSRNASYYFFSYRRMFGAVELTSADNPELQEKAGREGFRQNLAYKQMVEILRNFFIQLAADFFRKGTERGDDFLAAREELQRTAKIRNLREDKVQPIRNQFREDLEQILGQFSEGRPQTDIDRVLEQVRTKVNNAKDQSSEIAGTLASIDRRARQSLDQIRAHYEVVRPLGVGLSRDLESEFASWKQQYSELVAKDIDRAQAAIDASISKVLEESRSGHRGMQHQLLVDAEQLIEKTHSDWETEAQSLSVDARTFSERVTDEVSSMLRAARIDADRARSRLEDLQGTPTHQLLRQRRVIVNELAETLGEYWKELEPFKHRLRQVTESASTTSVDELEALEEEVLALRQEADIELELAQLGRAVEIINHEFAHSISAVRRNIAQLRPWGRANEQLGDIERSLSASFEHLDAYLTLFTPLQRRLYRRPITITGSEIAQFVLDLFSERLQRHNIDVEVTGHFRERTVTGYPSTFYPVFVNLVDNAIFWLSDRPTPRTIRLEAHGTRGLGVADNGPGVMLQDVDRIFEHGFTRKPAGRGIGLKISRDVLQRQGWSLDLYRQEGMVWPSDARGAGARRGALFVIEPTEADNSD